MTVLEALPRILPVEDSEIAEQLRRELTKQGIRIHLGARFAGCEKSGDSQKVRFTDSTGQSQELVVDKVLSAVGSKPKANTAGKMAIPASMETKRSAHITRTVVSGMC